MIINNNQIYFSVQHISASKGDEDEEKTSTRKLGFYSR